MKVRSSALIVGRTVKNGSGMTTFIAMSDIVNRGRKTKTVFTAAFKLFSH